jgi:hypothetical protein
MATHDLTQDRGATDGTRGPIRSGALQRLATETKAAFKTTEFYAFLVVLVGLLIAGNSIEGKDGGADYFAADKVWLYVTLLTVGYMISRGLAKAGSRDPYCDDHGQRSAPADAERRRGSHAVRRRVSDGPRQRPPRTRSARASHRTQQPGGDSGEKRAVGPVPSLCKPGSAGSLSREPPRRRGYCEEWLDDRSLRPPSSSNSRPSARRSRARSAAKSALRSCVVKPTSEISATTRQTRHARSSSTDPGDLWTRRRRRSPGAVALARRLLK